ncbi:MAG: hypothetical protein BJ554DRAFT_2587 [Olpidium bornovanus]|uniref:PQ loop repeat protein n=1 Tax=Olpidium bornovanus TaxID=278681 RepID=A0A8H7ZQK8_9FUNG|nr:MAG: hypothetical protein BJ554DRAFT_2587 [Olpidium bornovanus]
MYYVAVLFPVVAAAKGEGWSEILAPSRCPLPNHDPTVIAISVVLLLGMIASFLPQHYKIFCTKSAKGLSPNYLLLGTVMRTCGLLNIVLLQWNLFGCCRTVFTGKDCAESMLGVAQLLGQAVMFLGIVFLYSMYCPENKKQALADQGPAQNNLPLSDECKASGVHIYALVIYLAVWPFLNVVLILNYGSASKLVATLASVNGVTSMVLGCAQYVPQLCTTWREKEVGALSLPMMMLQAPGGFLLAYTIAGRPGTNWTSWITYVATGILQGALLLMCVVWRYRNRSTPLRSPEDPNPDDSELGAVLSDLQTRRRTIHPQD